MQLSPEKHRREKRTERLMRWLQTLQPSPPCVSWCNTRQDTRFQEPPPEHHGQNKHPKQPPAQTSQL